MTKTERLLCNLIALPSVNPAYLPPHDSRAGERPVADWLAAQATRAGLDVTFQPVLPNRSNVIIRLAPAGQARQRILLAPHLDTVGGVDTAPQLLAPQLKHGRLYGRGACDTKGSVAVMFAALLELARNRSRPAHTEIIFAGLVDEESGQAGSRALVADGFKAEFALVGEPTRLQVVTAHKGVLWLQLETHGKAAHGARPELGRNAVHIMARVVDTLETKYAASLCRRRHPLLGRATINVGAIHGGRQPNIVPAHCVMLLDRRTLPGENHRQVKREIQSCLRQRKLAVAMSDFRREPCRPLETSPRLPWVRQLLCIARQTAPAGVDYFSDAGVLAHGGIPSVVFGPGDIAQAHTPNEWVAVRQLERGRELLVRFLQSQP